LFIVITFDGKKKDALTSRLDACATHRREITIAVMHGAPPKRSINYLYERDTLLMNYDVKLIRVRDTEAQHIVQITVIFVQSPDLFFSFCDYKKWREGKYPYFLWKHFEKYDTLLKPVSSATSEIFFVFLSSNSRALFKRYSLINVLGDCPETEIM